MNIHGKGVDRVPTAYAYVAGDSLRVNRGRQGADVG